MLGYLSKDNRDLTQNMTVTAIRERHQTKGLRSAHTMGQQGMGQVPATSPCNKWQGLVASCELAIFATKSSLRDQNLVPATCHTNSNWFEFVGLVAGTKVGPCHLCSKI